MNLEQLESGYRLASEIRYAEQYEQILSDEGLIIRIDRNRHYGFEIEPGKWACDNCVEELDPEDNN